MDDRIMCSAVPIQIKIKKVQQPVFRLELFPVQGERQAVIQECIVPQKLFNVLGDIVIMPEDLFVRYK